MSVPDPVNNGHRDSVDVTAGRVGHDSPASGGSPARGESPVRSESPVGGTMHGDLSQMARRPMHGVLYLGVLAVAAGIDIATFYQVLALVMRDVPDEVVWLGVVGFTVTALTLAHTIGVRLRERVDAGDRALSSPSAWLCFVVWLFVGGTAFIVRLVAAAPVSSGGTTIVEEGEQVAAPVTGADNPLLAALLFLSLYLATGTVAALAGYLRHNPAARQYAATLRSRTSAARQAATSTADLTLARQTKVALDEERRRREEGWAKTQEEWAAIARRLKQEARLRMAAAAQNPSTTDAYFAPPTESSARVRTPPGVGAPASISVSSAADQPAAPAPSPVPSPVPSLVPAQIVHPPALSPRTDAAAPSLARPPALPSAQHGPVAPDDAP